MITISEVTHMAAIIDACQRNAPVARATDDGGLRYGTARCLARDESGAFAHGDADPATVLVRITWRDGFDSYPRLSELADQHATGMFVVDYTPH